jgi:exopolysaccharide production protein ExoQ
MSQIATLIFIVAIAGLFYLCRDPEAKTSKALWLSVVWLWIAGSRPISQWQTLGAASSADQLLDGSPLDRNVFVLLLALGIVVLFLRGAAVLNLLRVNAPLVLFLLYCAASVFWSDYPDVAAKRWIKSLGDYVMIMIILTDADRIVAIKRVLVRVSFLLLPVSILLIKYYPALGRTYDTQWDGTVFYTGVATNKNMLGMTCLIFGLGLVWLFLQEFRGAKKRGKLLAYGAVIAVDLYLLKTANSMTSLSCFGLGSALIVATSLPKMARRRGMVHAIVLLSVAFCFCVLFLDFGSFILVALGRNPTLTGRTDLWDALRGMAVSPLLGAGFESFWLGDRLQKLWSIFWWHPNESHNGYLEVYLNLGWAGLVLLGGLMVTGYRNIIKQLGEGSKTAPLWLAFFFVGVAYNFTEAAIRTVSPVWIFLIMAIITIPKPAVPLDVPERLPRLTGTQKKTALAGTPEQIPAYSQGGPRRGSGRFHESQ